MSRHDEIRQELRKLYAQSAKAIGPADIARIESQITYLEGEAAAEMTEAGR